MAMTNKKHKELRRGHCVAAADLARQLCSDADFRGVSHMDVAVSIAVSIAATNPTMAGEVLERCIMALRGLPVTKIVAAPPGTTVN